MIALGCAKALPSFAAGTVQRPGPRELWASQGIANGPGEHPNGPVLLRSEQLAVTLDRSNGLPSKYEFSGESLKGEEAGTPISVILCRLQPRSYSTVAVKPVSVVRTGQTAVFHFKVSWEENAGVEFSLKYELRSASLIVTLEQVVEHSGSELVEVALPNLVAVCEDDSAAWMAQGRDGGSFVRLADAKLYRYKDDENFGRVSTQLPIGMVGNGAIGCLMEVTAFMDGTETEVAEVAGHRTARMGIIQVHRVHGGRCYEVNDGNDPVCGKQETPNLRVEQQSRCSLDFYRVDDPATPWFPAAMLLRARMPLRPTKYFDDKFLFLIAGKMKIEAAPRTTLAESRRLIRDIARLTDYAPQVAYISGWVYDGQDTGYPSEDLVNASLGSYEQLMELMADSRGLNANVSVNVNYDDAYKSSPLFDPAFIAREPDGSLWKSRAWDGEDSFIVGMAKYVQGGWAKQRIEAMMERYRPSDAILIDALSWYSIRNDWDRERPASGYKNLVDGKWPIIDEFRKRAVHVTSEQFRYPMLGKLALTVNGPEPGVCPFGGEQVPLTAIIFRKAAIFGSSGDGKTRPQQSLFWNSRPGVWYENKTDRMTITDFYFLSVLPYNKVHLLDVKSYSSRGSQREITLEGNSKITIDADGTSYSVVWNGETIASNETTTCPLDEKRIAFYSQAGGLLRFPVPPNWKAGEITARRLTVDGRQPFPVRIEEEQIVVNAPARMPVMIYSDQGAIPPFEVMDDES
jgi:hypothetical protein